MSQKLTGIASRYFGPIAFLIFTLSSPRFGQDFYDEWELPSDDA
jgi:hypothetical protein